MDQGESVETLGKTDIAGFTHTFFFRTLSFIHLQVFTRKMKGYLQKAIVMVLTVGVA